jgi:hypothetical protein
MPWWTAVLTAISRFFMWLDARKQREQDRTELAAATREAEKTEREKERDATAEAHAKPGRPAVADRLRKGGF